MLILKMKILNKNNEHYTEDTSDGTITAEWNNSQLSENHRRDFTIGRYIALRMFMYIAGYKNLRGVR